MYTKYEIRHINHNHVKLGPIEFFVVIFPDHISKLITSDVFCRSASSCNCIKALGLIKRFIHNFRSQL